jgi:acyl-CoA hydrolase
MYQIKINGQKNRLYIILGGHPTTEEIIRGADEVIVAVKQLKPGFDVITDISDLRASNPDGAREISRVQQFVREAKVRRIVRVTKDAPFARTQFKRTGRDAGYSEDMILSDTASSIGEAEKMLDEDLKNRERNG